MLTTMTVYRMSTWHTNTTSERGVFFPQVTQDDTLSVSLGKTDDVYKNEPILKKRKKGRRVQYLVKWLGYQESFNSWIFKQDLQKRDVADWSVSLANGTEWHGECIVLGDLWKEDYTFGGGICVSGRSSCWKTLDIRATWLNTELFGPFFSFSKWVHSCIRRLS
jgi:hypothetical protein